MEKLNIAEILKDCPSGTKLYSTIHGEVELVDIYHDLIRCKFTYGITFVSFHSDGRWIEHVGECVLFPSKENRDWSNFHKPFENGDKIHLWTIQDAKDGDVIFCDNGWTCIFKCIHGIWFSSYCFITSEGEFHTGYERHAVDSTINGNAHLATKEQSNLLFQKIKEAGYKWNPETKTLEDLLKPKFKVGDKIQNRVVKTNNVYTIVGIKGLKYFVNMNNEKHNYEIDFEVQDDWELVPNKFDITTLKPFDEVLVRQCDVECWKPALWGRRTIHKNFPFITSFGATSQAIPFKNNEWLVGTTDDCDDYYKTWV